MRSFFVGNSEVGAATLGAATFLFNYVCFNRLVWGATEYREIKMKHTLKAPERFLDEVSPMLSAMVNAKASTDESVLKLAQSTMVSTGGEKSNREDDMKAFFNRHLDMNPKAYLAVETAHKAAEGRPMESLWDVATGVTEFAKSITFQNDRVAMERKAGLILDLVANK